MSLFLTLAISTALSIKIGLWAIGGFAILLSILIGYIVNDWKKDMRKSHKVLTDRLEKIDGGNDPEKGRLAKQDRILTEISEARTRQDTLMETLTSAVSELKNTIDEFKKEMFGFVTTASSSFQNKSECEHKTSHSAEELALIKKEWSDMRKEDRLGIKELTNTINNLREDVAGIKANVSRSNGAEK